MAGRRRFYKVVDVVIDSFPPWHHLNTDGIDTNDIDNPISAGVDGTLSASNVSLEKPSKASMILSLTPNANRNPNVKHLQNQSKWYGISLDGRTLRTPLGHPLSVPSLTLALAIANEWSSQKTVINPTQMPLMTLTCTTIDQLSIPSVQSSTRNNILNYLKNDTTCYWTDPMEDRVLYKKQEKHWKKLHDWICSSKHSFGLGYDVAKAIGYQDGIIMSRKRLGSQSKKEFAGLPHSETIMRNAKLFLEECDAWTLTSMQTITIEAKSFIVAMGLIRSIQQQQQQQQHIAPYVSDNGIQNAILASRVEEEFQIENWGLVEGQHDYDRLNASIQIHAACLLLQSIGCGGSGVNGH